VARALGFRETDFTGNLGLFLWWVERPEFGENLGDALERAIRRRGAPVQLQRYKRYIYPRNQRTPGAGPNGKRSSLEHRLQDLTRFEASSALYYGVRDCRTQ
jgi:hypothetical protein